MKGLMMKSNEDTWYIVMFLLVDTEVDLGVDTCIGKRLS